MNSTRSATSTPAGCARSSPATDERGAPRTRVPQASWLAGALGRPPPRHRRHRCRDVRWARRSWPTSRSGGDGTPGGGGVHPGAVRVGVGHVAVGRGPADRRRPRPAPPPPHALETAVPVGGAGLAGPPGRPPDPPPPQDRRPWVDEHLADRGTCGPVVVDRSSPTPSPRTTPRPTKTGRTTPRAGWDVTLTHPDPTDFLGTSHLEATGDTLVLQGLLRPRLRGRPPPVPRRRHQPAGRPQDQSPRPSSTANPQTHQASL